MCRSGARILSVESDECTAAVWKAIADRNSVDVSIRLEEPPGGDSDDEEEENDGSNDDGGGDDDGGEGDAAMAADFASSPLGGGERASRVRYRRVVQG